MTVSIIVYGRNDQVGYNAHKRVALSLNAMAEVLTHPNDEILFTDYNTENSQPTQLEAIQDSLTQRAKNLIRILRVRPNIHSRFTRLTSLKVNEPLSRNVAIRRANINNKWILSTNTDMIFVPKSGFTSLSDIIAELTEDSYYAVSRFELPETLWESLDRLDPIKAIKKIDEFGKKFHLNEITLTHNFNYYDAPGDFQLAPRKHYFDIGGFNESMILGWHVDSNFSRRHSLKYGMPQSLQDKVYSYHTSHTKISGTLHSNNKIATKNDYDFYCVSVHSPYIEKQSDNWGLADEEIEEIRLNQSSNVIKRFPEVLSKLIPESQNEPYTIDICKNIFNEFPRLNLYHVLPYVLEQLIHQKYQARILYIGVNTRMIEKLIQFSSLLHKDFQIFCLELAQFFGKFKDNIDPILFLQATELSLSSTSKSKDCSYSTEELIQYIQDHKIDSVIFDCGIDDKYYDHLQESSYNSSDLKQSWVNFFDASLKGFCEKENKLSHLQIICVCVHNNLFAQSHYDYLSSTTSPYTTRVIHGYPIQSEKHNEIVNVHKGHEPLTSTLTKIKVKKFLKPYKPLIIFFISKPLRFLGRLFHRLYYLQ